MNIRSVKLYLSLQKMTVLKLNLNVVKGYPHISGRARTHKQVCHGARLFRDTSEVSLGQEQGVGCDEFRAQPHGAVVLAADSGVGDRYSGSDLGGEGIH